VNRFVQYATLLEPHDLTFLAGVPFVYHCHHFNLFHDQTIDDVLGEDASFALRANVSASAFSRLLVSLFVRTNARTVPEKIEIAQALFASMGQGRISLELDDARARGRAAHTHYGYAWREKYGERVKRTDPADAVAAGFVAAVGDAIAGDGQRRVPSETKCIAMRADACEFDAPRGAALAERPPIPTEVELKRFLGASEGGLFEEEIATIAKGLQGFVKGVTGDDRGLIQAFNVFVTQHLSGYYNETQFAAIRHIEEKSPKTLESVESLFREAGHVCVFHTFGSILMSPEWEGMVGRLAGDPEEVVRGCVAIARGLGFGRWAIAEFSKGKRLVLRTTSNYEAGHWLARFGTSKRSRTYFVQGAALAFMVLAHRVQWSERPTLNQKYYDQLFRGKGLGFKVTPTRCLTMGDTATEVVIEAV
jgi:hypothetical protein